MNWKVVPICGFQRLDVRPEDLLNNGDFRKCETYRGGGGYDQFPEICQRRLKFLYPPHTQFVVQLYGCNLDCPYCYVTRSGVWGAWKGYTTEDLVQAFIDSKQEVFHLMGGAPALYLNQWPALLDELTRRQAELPENWVFHSDFLLTEREYSPITLREISYHHKRCLFAVDIKGVTPDDYEHNTRKPFKEELFWENLDNLEFSQIPIYLTFTNPDMDNYDAFVKKILQRYSPVGSMLMRDSFIIPLIEYDAQPFVDVRPMENDKILIANSV